MTLDKNVEYASTKHNHQQQQTSITSDYERHHPDR
jgi:hypothetical protein